MVRRSLLLQTNRERKTCSCGSKPIVPLENLEISQRKGVLAEFDMVCSHLSDDEEEARGLWLIANRNRMRRGELSGGACGMTKFISNIVIIAGFAELRAAQKQGGKESLSGSCVGLTVVCRTTDWGVLDNVE